MRFELAQRERFAELQFEDASVVSRRNHLGFEKHEITAALALGAIEREIRAPQQRLRIRSIDRGQRYSDARPDVRLMALEVIGRDQRLDYVSRQLRGVVRAGNGM